jgi:hypothetical protein
VYASVELDVAEKVAVVAMPAHVNAVVAVPDAKSSADVQVNVLIILLYMYHASVNTSCYYTCISKHTKHTLKKMSSALKISLINSYSHFRYLYYEKKV